MTEELSTPAKISRRAVRRDDVSVYRVPADRVEKEMRTHGIHLYVVQLWGTHEAAAVHLYLGEPFPPGRMPSGGTIEEYARIFRVARCTCAQAQHYSGKVLVAKVPAVTQLHLKGWAVQEREVNVESGKVELNETVQQVRLWKGVMRRVEAEGGTFPLFWPMSKATVQQCRRTRTECGVQNSGRRLANAL